VLGDGKIKPLATRRGCINPECVKLVMGRVYGIDFQGIWRLDPGGLPVDIGLPVSSEWKKHRLNDAQGANWRIAWAPYNRYLEFLLCEGDDVFPRVGYIWDLDGERWMDSKRYHVGVTAADIGLDDKNRLRKVFALEESVDEGVYHWMDDIGITGGADPTSTPMNGTVTSGSANTLASTGAAWITTGEALKGVAVTLVRAADASEETKIIKSNTASVLTIAGTWVGANPTSGDRYRIGPLHAIYRTGRIGPGLPTRKVKWEEAWVALKYKASCTPINVRVYYYGSATADSNRTVTSNENGVSVTASAKDEALDPTSAALQQRFRVPLHGIWADDIQLEFSSKQNGEPWEIEGPIEVKYSEEHGAKETRK
jgi:hypothetical protein